MSKKRLIVIDVSNFIFRAFYAIRPMSAPDGTPTNAVHGVISMFLKLFSDYRPTHLILARDNKGGSFRNKLYPQYKANRSEPPEELVPQFALIDELFKKMELPNIQIEDYEADDVIGSAVTQFEKDFDEIFIASGDKDLMQFVSDKIKILDTMKGKVLGPKEVREKMGVGPEQIVDYLSLIGDSSDNIPGVKGIGAKGAAALLGEYKTLDNILKNKDKVENKRAHKALESDSESAHLSKKLIQIVTDVDLGHTKDQIEFSFYPSDDLVSFLKGLGFRTLTERILTFKQIDSQIHQEEKPSVVVKEDYEIVKTKPEWKKYFEQLKEQSLISLTPFWADDSKHFGTLLYLAIANEGEKPSILCFGSLLRPEAVLDELFSLDKIEFVSHELKNIFSFCFLKNKKRPSRFLDLSQVHFVVDPSLRHDWHSMTTQYGCMVEPVELKGVGNLIDIDQEIKNFLAKSSKACFTVRENVLNEIKELDCEKVLNELDLPLIPLLSQMEMNGVSLDIDYYQYLDAQFSQELNEIQDKINQAGGEGINLRSPKQLRVLLFETLGLPIIKKTKTGPSTDSSVLTELASLGESEIPELILQYREIDKLLGTYVKTLPLLVNPLTKKIHTTFHSNNAATGRLSSDNPNLQNIPMRTERGRLLRRGFIASQGYRFLSADYSQMELRILAHCSGDETMIEAFEQEKDIHRQTAAEVNGKDFSQVSGEERNQAKAVNFGLMYGQSSFGLSEQLKISRTEAKEYIDKYFTRFNKVKIFLDELKEKCEKTGYAETLFGRKRVLKDIHSNNRTVKSMAERVAINSPIQGTAADIIKVAMLSIDKEMKDKNLQSKMILQIHDELVFEITEGEEEIMTDLVKKNMEGAMELKVPLKVEIGTGENWFDLK